MTMIGLRTGLTENRSDFEQWMGADDEAGIGSLGRAEIGQVGGLHEDVGGLGSTLGRRRYG